MPEILPYLVAALLYAGLAFRFWHVRAAGVEGPAAGAPFHAAGHYAVLVPLALHAWLLAGAAFAPDGLRIGVGTAVSAILWLTVLIYWLGSFVYRLDALQSLVLPIAAAATLLPLLLPSVGPLPNTDLALFKAHFLMAMLAYSLFTIASLHALVMALLERRLHDGSPARALRGMPPLLTMEAMLSRIKWTGFILLTATIATGIVFSE